MNWNAAIITLCSLLLLLLLWKEAKRRNKAWLVARIIASISAVTALACLALPVSVNRERKGAASSPVVLLTEGFNSDGVQAYLNANKEAAVFTMDKNSKAFNALYLPDVDTLSTVSFNTKAVHLFGYGLNETGLTDLRNTPFIFHPSAIQDKITSVGWTQGLSSGEPLVVQGSIAHSNALPVKLVLSGFDTPLDSVTVVAKGQSYFALSVTPKHLGRAVYFISVVSGKDTLEKEPVPVDVKSTQPLTVLLLAASPDFENKFLKAWLSQAGYKVAVRTLISKNKYDRQYLNTQPVSLDRITPSLLLPYDVVVADAAELSVLSSPELSAIRNAVEKEGTGLIVKADSAGTSSSFYLRSFPLVQTRDSIQHSIKPALGNDGHPLAPLRIEQPIYIRHVTGTQDLVKDQSLHTLAGSKLYGAGKVVLTTISNTYSWQLSGSADAYASYWSWLLGKAAKKGPLQQTLTVAPALPQANEEVHIRLQTVTETVPQLGAGEAALYPQQHLRLPYEWAATYWPVKSGWQPLSANENSMYWYVYSAEDWTGIKATERLTATKAYERSHPRQPVANHVIAIEDNVPVPKIYFLLLFLLSAGFLWAEKKFNGD